MQPIRLLAQVAASATHDAQNRLAVVRESAGLLQDLLAMSRSQDFPAADRFAATLALIQDNATQCGDLLWRLNRLAHLLDAGEATASEGLPPAEIDLREVLTGLVELTRRSLRAKGAGVTLALGAAPLPVRASAMELAMRLQAALDAVLDETRELLSRRNDRGAVTVLIASNRRDDRRPPELSFHAQGALSGEPSEQVRLAFARLADLGVCARLVSVAEQTGNAAP